MIPIGKTIVFYGYVYLVNNSLTEINKLYLKNFNPPKSLVLFNYSILLFIRYQFVTNPSPSPSSIELAG